MTLNRMHRAALAASFAALATVAAGVAIAAPSAPAQSATKVDYAPIAPGDYAIDPAHTSVTFSIRHMALANVTGRFKDLAGTIRIDPSDVTKSSVTFTAKTESIDTGVAQRDAHLRTPDFFDVAKYPELSFKSTKVERSGDGYVAHGDFTLHGVTKQIAIPFQLFGAIKDQKGGSRIGVVAKTTVNRQDFGMSYGGTLPNGALALGNEVDIELNVEAAMPGAMPGK